MFSEKPNDDAFADMGITFEISGFIGFLLVTANRWKNKRTGYGLSVIFIVVGLFMQLSMFKLILN